MAQYVYGKNVVKQILQDSSKIFTVYLAVKDEEVESMCRKNHIALEKCDKKRLDKLTGTSRHQGVVASIEEYKMFDLQTILDSVPAGENGLLVMLDELEDPHNLGAILRTCDAIGAHGVIIKKNNAVGLTPTVAKVSAGAIDTVKVASVTNLTQTLKTLKEKGYWVVGTDMLGQDYRYPKYDTPLVVIIGNEGKGISRLVKEECDYMVKLPMVGAISSLNASVAAGVLLYEVFNKKFPIK